jgi:hypothetical protein
LSEDPFRIEEDRLKDICADLVVVGGRTVFEREALPAIERTTANALAR